MNFDEQFKKEVLPLVKDDPHFMNFLPYNYGVYLDYKEEFIKVVKEFYTNPDKKGKTLVCRRNMLEETRKVLQDLNK